MSLIEQLGGYENARAMRDSNIDSFDGDASGVRIHYMSDCFYQEDLDLSLLKYRREHNIFEVGDLVIKTHPKNTILWPVLGVYKNGGVWLDYKGFCWKPPRVRHATDAEIEAGKRLEN